MPHAAECYALLLDTVSLRFARPDGNPVDRVASHFGLARPEFDAASRAYSAWRDTLGDDPDPAVLAAALAARPAVERAVGYWIDKVVPARDPDPAVEPLRHAAAAAIRLSAAESAADAGNAERFLDLLDESARDPDPWVRGALPPRVSDCVACVELSPAQRARLVAAYRALATDADDRVRAAALAHAPAGFPTPAPDDPSPRVRAAHPQTTEAELFAIARHPELEVASSVLRNARTSERAHLVLAYRFGVPYGRYAPGPGIACEHELALLETADGPEALAQGSHYWWPDERVDASREVEVRYEWFQEGSRRVEARLALRAPHPGGFTAAELLYGVLRELAAIEASSRPHFDGDRQGLGKQRCVFQLSGGDGRWSAALRK